LVVGSIIIFGIGGYLIQRQLIAFLLKPAQDQRFIYTSPGGGVNFLFQICIYFGVVLSIPLIVYQLLLFISPIMSQRSHKFLVRSSFFSAVLAICGLCFGYFVGLPGALHFLSQQFSFNTSIDALFTIQEYMSFVTIYLVGSALLFQIPLVMLMINRVKPQKPSQLIKKQRYVIVLAFIAAAIITPTPDIFNQLIIAGPIIFVYQLGVTLVWLANRRTKQSHLSRLRELDDRQREARLAQIEKSSAPLPPSLPPSPVSPAALAPKPITPATSQAVRTTIPSSVKPRSLHRRAYMDIIVSDKPRPQFITQRRPA
jgi:sec-independent protein translocase protein TatC